MKNLATLSEGQKRQIIRIGSDAIKNALDRLNLDNPGAQSIIECGNTFAEAIHTAATESMTDLSKIMHSDGYWSGYKREDVIEQIKRLQKLFPNINSASFRPAKDRVPDSAEGWLAIPKWEKIASNYCEAIQRVFELIKVTRGSTLNLQSIFKGEGSSLKQLHQTTRHIVWKTVMGKYQNSDILVFPAQFGREHRGRSARGSRDDMQFNEFGLGTFDVGIAILTHPECFIGQCNLRISCAGDECEERCGNHLFKRTPCFEFSEGEINLGSLFSNVADEAEGAASGFFVL